MKKQTINKYLFLPLFLVSALLFVSTAFADYTSENSLTCTMPDGFSCPVGTYYYPAYETCFSSSQMNSFKTTCESRSTPLQFLCSKTETLCGCQLTTDTVAKAVCEADHKVYNSCTNTCGGCASGYTLKGAVCISTVYTDGTELYDIVFNTIDVGADLWTKLADPSNDIYYNTGNVGIGTSNPNYGLQLHKSTPGIGEFLQITTGDTGSANNVGMMIGLNFSGIGMVGTRDNRPFVLMTNFTSKVTILADGNVGIGTTEAGSKLQVNGNAAIGYLASTTAPSNGLAVSGNVGIGTTTPSASLDIRRVPTGIDSFLVLDTHTTTNQRGAAIDFRASTDKTADRFIARIAGVREANGALTSLRFYTEAGSANGGLLERMRITPAGNVGIGTINPTAKLDVSVLVDHTEGALKAGYNTTASGNHSIAMGYNTTASGNISTAMGRNTTASGLRSIAMGNSTTASNTNSTAMGQLTTASGFNSTAMGNGTIASGDYSFAMGNSVTAQSFWSLVIGSWNLISGNQTSWVATDPIFVIGNGPNSSNRSNAMVVRKDGNVQLPSITASCTGYVQNLSIDSNGWLIRTGSTTVCISSLKYKQNVKDLDFELFDIYGLRPVSFEFNENAIRDKNLPEGMQIGLIAEELEEVMPEFVIYDEEGRPDAVDYTSLKEELPLYLLKAIQDQQKTIDDLKSRIELLESK